MQIDLLYAWESSCFKHKHMTYFLIPFAWAAYVWCFIPLAPQKTSI